MDLHNALDWSPPPDWRRITVIDSHAGGEPFRVIIDGVARIPGDTVLEQRRFAQSNLEDLRRLLMWEPRGHADMYGAILGPPSRGDSDLSALFLHNDGFSTMCGHGIIALAKVVLDTGTLPSSEPETVLRIDTPAGQIVATATVEDGVVGEVRFKNVPSFVLDLDARVEIEGLGTVVYDLAFGGAFYAFVTSNGAEVDLSDPSELISLGRRIKAAVSHSREIPHPFDPDLGFLYGVIFVGPAIDPAHHSRHVCVFADGEIDRSPTGTGVSARLAIHHARGDIAAGEMIAVESIVGSVFEGRIIEEVRFGPHDAVIPEISGTAHITGKNQFWIDPGDSLGRGFFLR